MMMMLLTTLPTIPALLTTLLLLGSLPTTHNLNGVLVVGMTTGTALVTMASIITPTGIGSNSPALPPLLLQQRVASLVQRVASPAQRAASPEAAEEREARVAPMVITMRTTMMMMMTLVDVMHTSEDLEEEEEDTRDTVADMGVATVADTVVMTTGATQVVMTTGATPLGRAAPHTGLEAILNPPTCHVLLHVLQAASQERPRAERRRAERLRKDERL